MEMGGEILQNLQLSLTLLLLQREQGTSTKPFRPAQRIVVINWETGTDKSIKCGERRAFVKYFYFIS